MQESIDELDARLIRVIEDNPRIPFAEVARLTGVSETTAKRRIEALFSSGVIIPAILPNLTSLGYRVTAIIGMRTVLKELPAIAEQIRTFPEVTFVALTTGRYDLVIFAVQTSLDDLTRFLLERLAPVPGILETETLVAPRVLKTLADWRLPTAGPQPDGAIAGDGRAPDTEGRGAVTRRARPRTKAASEGGARKGVAGGAGGD